MIRATTLSLGALVFLLVPELPARQLQVSTIGYQGNAVKTHRSLRAPQRLTPPPVVPPVTLFNVFKEDFDAGIPGNWGVTDDQGLGLVWTDIAGSGEFGNYCGSGDAATCSSDRFGTFAYDASLISPIIDLTAVTEAYLEFDANFQSFSGLETFEVDVSYNGGGSWTNLLTWNDSDHGAFRAQPGEHVVLDLGPVTSLTRIRFVYANTNTSAWDWYAQVDNVCVGVPCDQGLPLVIDSHVYFTDLDGSAVDYDGVADGTLSVLGLIVEGWGKIIVNTPSAKFHVNSDIVLRDDGRIENLFPLPDFGPHIGFYTCGSFEMHDRARLRSYGHVGGGSILIDAMRDFLMEGISGIECTGFDLPEGSFGGSVDIFGESVRLEGFLAYITVEATYAGSVTGVAWGTDDDAVSVRGRILADGTDPGGFGGLIHLAALDGGIFLPGVDNCIAHGEGGDGAILLDVHTILWPIDPPIVDPEAIITWIP